MKDIVECGPERRKDWNNQVVKMIQERLTKVRGMLYQGHDDPWKDFQEDGKNRGHQYPTETGELETLGLQ